MSKWILPLFLALSVSAMATLNKEGLKGINKTQSAQSMGHSNLAISILGDITNDNRVINGYLLQNNFGGDPSYGEVSEFWGGNAYVAIGLGIWHYFDFSIMLPVYYEDFTVKHLGGPNEISGLQNAGIGNIRPTLKIRLPLPEDQVFDIAAVIGGDFGTSAPDKNKGLWMREPEFVNKETRQVQAFGFQETTIRAKLAATIDFDKLDNGIPLQFHLNGGYRHQFDAKQYNDIYSFSAAAEWQPLPVLSIFAEYYMDFMPELESDVLGNQALDLNELSAGLVFHLPGGLDIHAGMHLYLGDEDLYLAPLYSLENDERVVTYAGRVNPGFYGYGGITWSMFLVPLDRDGDGVKDSDDQCPDEYGAVQNFGCPWANPDIDEDGICDAWVAEKGLFGEFADICDGIDKCPNEAGDGDDGCPLDNPDVDGDGVCDAWVSQKNMSSYFADVCSGVDNCPAQKGPASNFGCPDDNPDADGDGLCDPWVSQKNRLNDFSGVCKSYDECPGEAGPVANKGCPWPDPDTDGDGICDTWVTEKKMGYFFETTTEPGVKKCKGLDKCQYEYGSAENDGCPMENPDSDSDGMCDAWVSQKGMQERFSDICTGIDKCPTEPGLAAAQGCPMDNPDIDADSVCAPWVAEKGMFEAFKDICKGIDKCPSEAGDPSNDGCPLDNPDTDADGVCDPWVTQKKMLDRFKDICVGMDRCPFDPGSVEGNGCPAPVIEENVKLEGVTFKSGSSVLEVNAKKVLKGIAEQLLAPENKNVHIEIHGHTDNVGKKAKNKKLSQDRAQSVVNYLASQGVPKSRMKAFGHGDEEPVADNATKEGKEQNRRIEMHRVD